MLEKAFAISPHDNVHAPFILRRMKGDRLAIMDEYESLVCKKCRKVNERAAFTQGIQRDVVVRSKRPFLISMDDFYMLDERAKQVFSALFPEEIEYYPIPSGAFWVATPKIWMEPDETNPGFRFASPRCTGCGRVGEAVWGKEPLVVAERKRLFAINLESVLGARAIWVVFSEVAATLKEITPPLTGMVLSPKQVNVTGPV